jgi:cytochrome P450
VVTELAPGDAPLTPEQEAELVWSLGGVVGVVGSANSVASVLGMGTYYLLDVPERWAALVARPRMIGNAIEEICRYDTPAQTFARITTRPVTLGGVDLPAGAELMVMLGSANRDERLVDEPEHFDITRPRMRHVTFGQGTHICLGAPVVRAVLRVTLETLAHKMPGLRLAEGHEVRIAPMLNHRQPLELHITW